MAATTVEASAAYSQMDAVSARSTPLTMLNSAGFDIITADYRPLSTERAINAGIRVCGTGARPIRSTRPGR